MSRSRSTAGFTLVELVLVGAIGAVIAAISAPAIQEYLIRSKIEGFARTTTAIVRQCRLETVKTGRASVLIFDVTNGGGTAFFDDDGDLNLDLGERQIGRLDPPGGVGWLAPGTDPVVDGFQTGGGLGWVSFLPDGSVDRAGAIRIGDLRGNRLEVRVAPAATAKIVLRKWNGELAANTDGSHWYARGEGEEAWTWQ